MIFRALLVVFVFSISVYTVNGQNADCGDKRCIRNDGNFRFTTCGASCNTIDCNDVSGCPGSTNSTQCSPSENCVSALFLKAMWEFEGRDDEDKFEDPCCTGVWCFSSKTTALVKHQGTKLVKDLEIGEEVLTGSGNYQRIYTIDHRNPTKKTEFVQIYTSSGQSPIELTKSHLIFLHNKRDPIPAGQVKVGDALIQAINVEQQPATAVAVVTNITSVIRDGLWNPITEDGTIVVNGIVTSTYTSLDIRSQVGDATTTADMYLTVAGFHLVSMHDFLHMIMTPYRSMCTYTNNCHVMEGRNTYSKLGYAILEATNQLPPTIQNTILVGLIVSSSALYITMVNPMATFIACILMVVYYMFHNNNNNNITTKNK